MKKIIVYGIFALVFFAVNVPATEAATTTQAVLTEQNVEMRVREYFKDMPVMIEIARCESKFRQYTDSGSPLRGGSSGGMVGVFQFFESIHSSVATNLGFDLTTLEGNIAYAKHVYESEGVSPWNSAKACWDVPIEKLVNSVKITTSPAKQQLEAQVPLLLKIIELLKELQRLRA